MEGWGETSSTSALKESKRLQRQVLYKMMGAEPVWCESLLTL